MSVTLITPTANRFNLNIQTTNKIQSCCQNNIKAPQTNCYVGKFPFSGCYLSFKSSRENLSVLDSFRLEFKKLGVSPEITDNIQPEEMKKWDIKNIYTLQWLNEPNLINLINHSLQGTYKDFLFDSKTDIGKTNLETKKSFESEGLNYDKWLNYEGKKEFESEGKQYEIGLWKREPGKDLFIGNHTDSCISTIDNNNDVIYGGLVNTNVQYILIKEKATKGVKAYARVYFMKEEKSKEKNIMLARYTPYFDDSKAYDKAQQQLLSFIEDYSKAVTNNNSSKILLNSFWFNQNKGNRIIKDKFETIGKVAPCTRTSTSYKSEPDFTKKENQFSYILINQ
ncbi:MAG: hypothetical protein WCG23_12400 [bacterium]